MVHDVTRRSFLAATAAGLAVGGCARTTTPVLAGSAPSGSLDALARATGRRFGSAVAWSPPGADRGSFANPRYAALVTAECGVIVAENEMKWGAIRPSADRFDFDRFDAMVDWAERETLGVRGHTLVWHHPEWFPDWVTAHDFGSRAAGAAARMVREHVSTVCARYGRRIYSYDVINEAVDNETGGLRETPLSRAMGGAEPVLDLAFRTAREAAPHAQLVYNDYMAWEPWNATHRTGVLRLLEGFRRRNVPVDALGIQSHIGTENSDPSAGFGARQEAEWRRFIDETVAMGYGLEITEFDIHDKGLPADIPARDRAVADYARAYFDLMLSYPQLGDVLAWGMTDRYSWLQERWERPDGLPKRPLPYDAEFQPKPLLAAMRAAFQGATPRAARS